MNDTAAQVGRNIQAARDAKGWSQGRLAGKLGRTQRTAWETYETRVATPGDGREGGQDG